MNRTLETYLDRKGLVLNAEKTKVIRFGRGGRRKKKEAKVVVEEKGDRRGEEGGMLRLQV